MRFAIALFATVVAGCGSPSPNITLEPYGVSGVPNQFSLVVTNTGRGATAPLTVGLVGDPAFSLTGDACTGASLAPQDTCVFIVTVAGGTHSATVTVDGGHGAHATYPVSVHFSDAPLMAVADGPVDVDEGQEATSTVTVTNIGDKPSGYINVYLPFASASICNGGSPLAPNESCTSDVQYIAPFGNNAPVRLTGTVSGDPGESAAFEVDFNILGQLTGTPPSFGSNTAAGATASVAVTNTKGMMVGPLHLSIDGGSGTPQVTYPPFLIVTGQDDCNGATLDLSIYTCNVWLELDPRLPAGGSYSATLTVGAADETLSVPVSAMLAP
jgi:hypothetical protein